MLPITYGKGCDHGIRRVRRAVRQFPSMLLGGHSPSVAVFQWGSGLPSPLPSEGWDDLLIHRSRLRALVIRRRPDLRVTTAATAQPDPLPSGSVRLVRLPSWLPRGPQPLRPERGHTLMSVVVRRQAVLLAVHDLTWSRIARQAVVTGSLPSCCLARVGRSHGPGSCGVGCSMPLRTLVVERAHRASHLGIELRTAGHLILSILCDGPGAE
jgi:hypothetical protein